MSYSFKKNLVSGLAFVLIFSLVIVGYAQEKPEVKSPDSLTVVTYGTANTLDPSYGYDTSSGVIIQNIYENLIMYPYSIVDGNQKNLEDYSVSEFKPMLATKVPSMENGLVRETPTREIIYEFPIRQGVTFHNGNELTPEDVEYSFERTMIQDRNGGPSWMLLEPLTGYSSIKEIVKSVAGVDDFADTTQADRVAAFNSFIDPAVEVKGNSVIFKLPKPYPPFLSIVAHNANWAAIMDKEWVAEQGGWPGTAETWVEYHNPGGGSAAEKSPLYDKTNGTGPFKLERWDPGTEVVFSRNEDYWREPAKLKRAVIQKIEEWSTRRLKFMNGEADIAAVSPQYLEQVQGAEGVTVQLHLPTIQMNPVAFFTQDVITENNEYVGSGEWGDGVPSNFFNDIKVRKAFCYAFEYEAFIKQVLRGLGYKTNGPVPKNMQPFYNDDLELYSKDLDKAEQLLKESHGGTLWEKGFKFTILYNSGNESRKTAANIFEANIESLNSKFDINVRGVDWSTYLDMMISTKLPLFIIGWSADYPDPHNFVVPFMASDGTFSGWQGKGVKEMANSKFEPLIEEAMATVDVEERKKIYYELQKLAKDLALDAWLPQSEGFRVLRNWVQDVPFNPVFSDPYAWMYPIWKGYEE